MDGGCTFIANRFRVLGQWSDNLLFGVDLERSCDYEFQTLVMIKHVHVDSRDLLAYEDHVYKSLDEVQGFPILRWSGVWGDEFYIIMDYMGCNFERLRSCYPEEFNAATVAVYAVQMIQRVKHLHLLGFIHGDIKPDNFTLGPVAPGSSGARGVARVNLIDFTTSRPVSSCDLLPPMCNPFFASIRTLLGHPLARCDDLEALAYTFLYLLFGERLPWMEDEDEEGNEDFVDLDPMSVLRQRIIVSKKLAAVPEQICDGLPAVYANFLRYARELDPDVLPDYDYFIQEFSNIDYPWPSYIDSDA